MARFYTRFEPDPALVDLYSELQAAAAAFERAAGGDPRLEVRAIRAIEVMRDIMRRLTIHSRVSAANADRLIRERIEATRVRPRASGRMSAHVISRALPSSVPSGAIGVADLDELDRSNPASRMGRSGIPYWMAQEYGSSAAVGRRLTGFFTPGFAAADPGQFRVHPFFEVGGPQAPRMVIKNPIEARHFLRDGSRDALDFHHRELKAIDRLAIAGIRSV